MGEDPWTTREEDFWDLEGAEARSRFVVNYAVLAPSAKNTQPWLFAATDREIDVYADRRRGLAVSDPQDRQLTLSCGSALFFLTIAMRRFGRTPIVHTFPDLANPDHLANVRWGRSVKVDPETQRLFEAMTHPNVQVPALARKAPDERLVSGILDDLNSPGVSVTRVLDSKERAQVGELTLEADRIQAADGRFIRERENWSHPDRRLSRDGWPQLAQSRPQKGKPGVSARTGTLSTAGPALVVLGSHGDSRASWLESGRLLGRLALRANAHGLSVQFLNAPLEIPSCRQQIDRILSNGWKAQALLRVGYPKAARRPLRRPVSEVLRNGF